ncbi:MAG: hypothetical protein HYW26_04890 [Candidatus Aenigmarchaeota archaeon]|nr:hypothetical protein [Candidatus Aenigmarchaeota archaeon]
MKEKTNRMPIMIITLINIPADSTGGNQVGIFSPEEINGLRLIARGAAVWVNDPESFRDVKLLIAAKKSYNEGVALHGFMRIGSRRIKAGNVSISNGSLSGSLYRNDTLVGSFSLKPKENNTKLWHGTMNLDGHSYNLYLTRTRSFHKRSEGFGFHIKARNGAD